MADNLSIIIRNRNEENWIGYAIQSCLDTFNDPEIIIVDNNSIDQSMEIVNEFCFSNIKIMQIDNYSPGRSLNMAVRAASNDTILVLSAHSVITRPINLDRVKSNLRQHAAVFGKQTPVYRGRKITKRYVWSHFTDESVVNMWSDAEERHFLHNAFCFYDKSVLLENKFDERLSGKEDRYWANKVVSRGFTYLYDVELQCDHHWTPAGNTWKGLG
tara:strand:- start:53090 stop:53734 length:645 start_codon:yes stop_codon:yes gene_type:complete